MSNLVWTAGAFILYAALMIYIGGKFVNQTNTEDYFLGGRGLNSWVAAMSAQASDMSGWLLMGLPGAVYALGTGQMWIAAGLAAGTILNWIFVSKRLRRYTILAGNSITIPEYFENRFQDGTHILRGAAAIFITIFFTVYTASAFVSSGALFSVVFGIDYQIALIIGVVLILVYTFLGGFMAVCWTDFIQGMLMLAAILAVPILAVAAMGGVDGAASALSADFLNPLTENGQALTGISIISQLAWGLGYFGMPHILVRFMAVESERSLKKSQAIAIIWVILSLSFAVLVGAIGAAYLPGLENSEHVFIKMIQRVLMSGGSSLIHLPLLGGLFLCGILAAIMSTADSQLLVTASAISGDLYKGMIKKDASDKTMILFSRGTIVAVAVVAYLIATDPNSSIMALVSNAWSGFGSAFGALVLLSLYWKRANRAGAAAGIISGGLTVIVWDYIPFVNGGTLGAFTGLYSLVPGFAISFASIIIVSLLTKAPSEEMKKTFHIMESASEEELNRLARPGS